MSPVPRWKSHAARGFIPREVTKPTDPDGLVLEAWAEGYMVGSLIILSCITISNMRRKVLLHKLILLELVLGYWQGFFILFNPPIYAWWLSVAAIFLNASWSLHNVISWMKLRPFLSKNWSRFFIGTIILVQPYWVVEIYANFTYFHNVNNVFLKTRPWEALFRDPWWIAAAVLLLYNIKTKYEMTALQIIRISPRFAVMLFAMMLSIAFIILDILSVTDALSSRLPVGINPFWKLSFVFKCLTDAVVLDDFKTALDRLRAFKISRLGSFAIDTNDSRVRDHHDAVLKANAWDEPPPPAGGAGRAAPIGHLPPMPSSDVSSHRKASAPAPLSDHVEDQQFAGIVRAASRDRDVEENDIHTIDHALLDQNARHRSISEAHILKEQAPWGRNHSATSSDADGDYAAAVRQMTQEAKDPRSGGAIGTAK